MKVSFSALAVVRKPHDTGSPAPADELQTLRAQLGPNAPQTLYRGRGCRRCQGSGYLGRTGIFEMMAVDESIRTMVLQRASAGDIRRQAARYGMKCLREDGWRLLGEGKTSLAEVLRVTKDERLNGPVGGPAAGAPGSAAPRG